MGDYLILIILFFSPLILMFIHIGFVRITSLLKINISHQLSIILIELLLNIPLVIFVYSVNKSLSAVIYSLIVYNCLGYSYFHFFNLSETARRIRILAEIRKNRVVSYEYLADIYEKSGFNLKTRLDRLIDLGQVKRKDDKYILSGKILLAVAFIVKILRGIIGFS